MSWLRLEAAFFQNPASLRAGWNGRLVMLAALTMSKLHGWDGVIEREDFDPLAIRAHLGMPDSACFAKDAPCDRVTVCHCDAALLDAIERCVRAKMLVAHGDRLEIKAWRKFQPDPTNAARQRKSRENRKRKKAVTVNSVSNGTGQDRTGRTGQTDVQTGGAGARDLPVDASLSESGPGGGGLNSGQRLSDKAWFAVGVILDCLAKGYHTADSQQRALELRRQLRDGVLADAVGSELLDQHKARFAKAIADAKPPSGEPGGPQATPAPPPPTTQRMTPGERVARLARDVSAPRSLRQRAFDLGGVPERERDAAWDAAATAVLSEATAALPQARRPPAPPAGPPTTAELVSGIGDPL